jgi:2-oxoisovalerate dehydrogenase E1 component alpha subunit
VTSWAAERARAGLGPTLIEWLTYRVGGHSTSDDPSSYRSDDDVTAWPLGDPIARLQQHLSVTGVLDDDGFGRLRDDVEAEVLAAQQEAESHGTLHDGARLSPRLMFEDVFADMPPHLRAQRQAAGF